ncbi:unnamed protein product [Nyctereutes procyonoides]|uniref:Probable E3 SUMO-protein ligase RNF212 n=1 Tax=Nyctereutes procyonoides TaxID=34880 RepID=A0A811YMZ7_NYCPR|nr:unnamed protein product [Nyctereutes procyonoides]
MAGWVFCNRCFQPPHRASRFSLTNCGHVYCDVCLRKGGKDECLICKVPCRTLLLSKHTDVDIQALFMGIDGLCKKYSRETSQVSEFQEKHRRRLLAFYREKIARLEESLQKSVLRMEQLQSMRLSQEPVLGAMKTPVSTPSAKPAGHLLLRLESSASDRVESMQVDRTPSPTRKVSTPAPCAASPTRSFCGFSVRQETGGHRPPWGLLDECWPSSERVGWLAGRVLKTVAGAPPPQAEPDRQAGGRERCWVVRTNHHPPSQLRNPGEEPTGNSGGELGSFPV